MNGLDVRRCLALGSVLSLSAVFEMGRLGHFLLDKTFSDEH